MAMTHCRECGAQISTKARACPACGAPPPGRIKWWLWLPLGLAAAFLGYGYVLSNTPDGQARAHQRSIIELCWQDYHRKSIPPDQKHHIAATCERLETDYRRQFGRRP